MFELHDLHDRLHLTRDAELVGLLQENRGVLSRQRQIAPLRPRLPDLGDVTCEVLGADRWEVLAHDLLLGRGDLALERHDAVPPPRVVAAKAKKRFSGASARYRLIARAPMGPLVLTRKK